MSVSSTSAYDRLYLLLNSFSSFGSGVVGAWPPWPRLGSVQDNLIAGKVVTQSLHRDDAHFRCEGDLARIVAFLILGEYNPSLLQICAPIQPL